MSVRPAAGRRAVAVTALAWILLAVVGGCSRSETAGGPLWSDERVWSPVEGGWVRGVPLTKPRFLRTASGQHLRAVVFPSPGRPATLSLETPGGQKEIHLAGPTPIDFELGEGGRSTLAATEEVHLLHARLLSGERPGRGRKILLAVADTLRFDHADRERMPEVWSYFAGGTRFLHAYSPAAWTLPSLASIFTGELPVKLRSPDGTLISLGSDAGTLASKLAGRGFVTAGVTANYTVNHENGFSQGFDLFYTPSPREHNPGDFPDARWVGERALEIASWFEEEDFFVYLQYMEPHEPYRNHESGEALNLLVRGEDPDPGALAALRSAYASEVRYLSRELGVLLQRLGDLDLAVFTADHGEELFDHRGYGHGPTLSEEVVRVPLWVRGRGVEARTVDEPVSLVTLADLILRGSDPGSRDAPVTMETFTFGPPRWSCIIDRKKVIYFARGLEAQEPSDGMHPTARWLLEHHPRIFFSDLEGRPVEPGAELVRRSVDLLQEHYAGHRRGLFVRLEEVREAELRATGVGRDGLWWGDAASVEVTEADGKLAISVRAPQPFVLLFLPQAGDAAPRLFDAGTGEPVVLGLAPPARSEAAVTAWLDPGRPAAELRGAEETLKRLEALGYL